MPRTDADRERDRRRWRDNKPAMRTYQRAWRVRNKALIQARSRVYREANRERINEWFRRNRDYSRDWLHRNKDRNSVYQSRKRAKRKAAPGRHTVGQWRQRLVEFGAKCLYCPATTALTQDHNVPLSRGGSNDIENIVPACLSCNSKKGTRTAVEFLIALHA